MQEHGPGRSTSPKLTKHQAPAYPQTISVHDQPVPWLSKDVLTSAAKSALFPSPPSAKQPIRRRPDFSRCSSAPRSQDVESFPRVRPSPIQSILAKQPSRQHPQLVLASSLDRKSKSMQRTGRQVGNRAHALPFELPLAKHSIKTPLHPVPNA